MMLEHGGNLHLASQQYHIPVGDWLDLSTGINPHGYPIPPIDSEIWRALPNDDDGLNEAACAYYGSPFSLPVAGSQAVLQILPQLRRPGKVALLHPMYNEHARAWQRHGHQVSVFTEAPDDATLRHADVVVLCNPNNPTAQRFTVQDLLHWHSQLSLHDGWLVVDEAFMDATAEQSIAPYTHYPGLFVLRSLGKFFGLAGARVGFLLAQQQSLHLVQEALGPWPIPGASRLIAQHALNNKIWQENTRLQLIQQSQKLADLLSQHGLNPSAGTALFQYVPHAQATLCHQHLAKQGIWVRLFSTPSALRFGLPDEPGWGKLDSALDSWHSDTNG